MLKTYASNLEDIFFGCVFFILVIFAVLFMIGVFNNNMNKNDIPAGTYKARGIAGSAQHSKTKNGNDQISLRVKLLALDKEVVSYIIFSDNSRDFSLARLTSLGWEEGEQDFSSINKNEVEVLVKYDTFNGKEQMKVDILTPNRSNVTNLAPEETKSFLRGLSSKPAKMF